MEQKPFADLFVDVTKRAVKIQKKDYLPMGRYPIIDQGQEWCAGFTNEEKGLYRDVPAYIFGDHTRVIKYVDKPFYLGADGVKLLKLREGIQASPRFFYYALKSQRIPDTGYNRHFKWLKESLYHVPTLDEQTHIADILDTLSMLITLCEKKIFLFNELVKSQFIEMFGDPVTNPMGWETSLVRDTSELISDGPFGSNLKSSHYVPEGIRVIRLGNIGIGKFLDEDKAYISEEHYATLKKYTCHAGEIVIGTLGEPNLRACLIPDDIAVSINKSDCVHFIPKTELLNNIYACAYLNTEGTLQLAQGSLHGQTRSRIAMSQVAALPIMLPPLALQNKFAAFVEQVDKSKLVLRQLLEKQKTLKAALMQEYFS